MATQTPIQTPIERGNGRGCGRGAFIAVEDFGSISRTSDIVEALCTIGYKTHLFIIPTGKVYYSTSPVKVRELVEAEQLKVVDRISALLLKGESVIVDGWHEDLIRGCQLTDIKGDHTWLKKEPLGLPRLDYIICLEDHDPIDKELQNKLVNTMLEFTLCRSFSSTFIDSGPIIPSSSVITNIRFTIDEVAKNDVGMTDTERDFLNQNLHRFQNALLRTSIGSSCLYTIFTREEFNTLVRSLYSCFLLSYERASERASERTNERD